MINPINNTTTQTTLDYMFCEGSILTIFTIWLFVLTKIRPSLVHTELSNFLTDSL